MKISCKNKSSASAPTTAENAGLIFLKYHLHYLSHFRRLSDPANVHEAANISISSAERTFVKGLR